MFIAFEGPDETGKSSSAATLAHDNVALYNATKGMHNLSRLTYAHEQDLVVTYDRIDWLTHMVYRLAMPTRDWDDDRPRTVFAMPDTHLVLKLHAPDRVADIHAADEGYKRGALVAVNEMYYRQIDFLSQLNRHNGYTLFRSVSMVEVHNDKDNGVFHQQLVGFDSPSFMFEEAERPVTTDQQLLEFLRYVESQEG